MNALYFMEVDRKKQTQKKVFIMISEGLVIPVQPTYILRPNLLTPPRFASN